MKRAILLLVLLSLASLTAQENVTVQVKGHETNSGVVLISAQYTGAEGASEKGHFELQCTKGMPNCNIPDSGTYLMVRLPKNWGMYDCANVDLYPADADPKTSSKVGEYCLLK